METVAKNAQVDTFVSQVDECNTLFIKLVSKPFGTRRLMMDQSIRQMVLDGLPSFL